MEYVVLDVAFGHKPYVMGLREDTKRNYILSKNLVVNKNCNTI